MTFQEYSRRYFEILDCYQDTPQMAMNIARRELHDKNPDMWLRVVKVHNTYCKFVQSKFFRTKLMLSNRKEYDFLMQMFGNIIK